MSLLLLLAACGGNADLRTLDSCETNIASDAPTFFTELFRCVDVAVTDDAVVLSTVDLPPHPSAYYDTTDPNWEAFDERDGSYHQNPNTIAEQAITLSIPLDPTPKGITITDDLVDLEAQTSDEEYALGASGVSLDGSGLFNSLAGPGDDIAEEKYTFDSYEAHPENSGTYHHHGATPAPLAVLVANGWSASDVPGEADIEVYGVMCDGTVVLGCTELDGSIPDDTDFDAQGGHLHDMIAPDGTTWFSDRYHTHVCVGVYAHEYTPEIQYYEGCEGVGR